MNVRLTAGGKFLAAVAVLFAAAAVATTVVLSAAFARSQKEVAARASDSVHAHARVLDVVELKGKEDRRWAVNYTYEVDGASRAGQTRVRRIDRGSYVPGRDTTITYLTSDPTRSWLAGYEPEGMPVFVIPMAALGLLASAALIGWQIRSQWILLEEGRVVPARITGLKKVHHSHGGQSFRVNCEFRTLSGALHIGRFDARRQVAEPGAETTIVYHRDDPGWHARYPLPFVRFSPDND